MPDNDYVAILDFGSQYTQLIARRTREASVYCEILPPDASPDALKKHRLKGIILSGGPASVYQRKAPTCDPKIFELGVPVLGICYGMQLGAKILGSKVSAAAEREYGRTDLKVKSSSEKLVRGVPNETQVWMSHGDKVEATSKEFEVLASSKNCAWAAVRHKKRSFYGVQFHPEVQHTPYGTQILRNFLYAICGCRGDWEMKSYVDNAIAEIRRTAGKDHILCALSGGVDSGVVAALVHKAVSSRLTCVFVDNGLLRKGEAKKVRDFFEKRMHVNLVVVDASNKFLNKLKGVSDPEKKRTIIGHTFIDIFKAAARPLKQVKFLAQGTLYPDVIESRSATGGPSVKIKTHHNVGGLPDELGFKLIEPLRTLFKDEARRIGRELGLPEELVRRQPFPGPGLAVRCPGPITPERLDVLREADEIVVQEIEKAKLQDKIWQYFAVLLPVKSVGVMGDERTYQETICVRIVESLDGMTADWARVPYDILGTISSRIVNEVKGVNRVVYDISSKPPSTIEWE
ncbi:MAG TPA: glutamine-hydrolyzing GMP synthase [Planctomycetota bacterium]|nr:glutamine-hydrolyzing GMP synthase [Planctomycetota bacterium]